MEQYIIKGGKPLFGEVTISGYKNAALGIIAAAVMTDETVKIENVPDIKDIDVLLQAIEDIGAKVNHINRNTITINGSKINTVDVDFDYVRKIRASYYLVGALLGKYKGSKVALPGGCNIGSRPIEQHIKGFEALGAEVKIEHGMICAEAEELKGAHIYFDCSSVGATINVMMAAVMAEGLTILENSAKEPHVVDVANFLNSMGANIKGAGTDIIRIKGVPKLHGSEYSIIPDQIEAGTFMFAAAATKGDILIKNVIPKHLESITAKLAEMDVNVEEYDDSIRVWRDGPLQKANIKTMPYPGFPTDLQPQTVALLSTAQGTSIVTESVWENRYQYVDELRRLGARISVDGKVAVIEGVKRLSGAPVMATDLRAGAGMVIAALMAEGITQVHELMHIDRGYENLEQKLKSLGAQIVRSKNEDDTLLKDRA
jgi:UDP-N-acetylglucosamine 1-carboxyvinyltransferase